MSGRVRDRQQSGVYDTEDEFLLGWMQHAKRESRERLQAFADAVCRRYRVPEVRVVCPRKHSRYHGQYFGDYDPPKVKLYVKRRSRYHGRSLPVLLHELAHHITDCKFQAVIEAHGPHFVAVAADLYHRYKVAPKRWFLAEAKRRGVKVARLKKKLAR